MFKSTSEGFEFKVYKSTSASQVLLHHLAMSMIAGMEQHKSALKGFGMGDEPRILEDNLYIGIEKMAGLHVYTGQLAISPKDEMYWDFVAPFRFTSEAPMRGAAILNAQELQKFSVKYMDMLWFQNLKLSQDDSFVVLINSY